MLDEFSAPGLHGVMYSSPADGGKGGDVYYLSYCGTGEMSRFAVVDVVGHGEAVSEISGWLYDILRGRITSAAGDEVLVDLNLQACERGIHAMATSVIAGYRRDGRQLDVAYAGHHPILVSRNGRPWESAKPVARESAGLSGIPIGVDETASYSQDSMPLGVGDRAFVYTDGLIEARDASGEFFSDERLSEVLDDLRGQPLQATAAAIVDSIRGHAGGELTHDDVTFMLLEIGED